MANYSKGKWTVAKGSKKGGLHIIRTLPNGGVDRICEIVIPSTGYRVNAEANADLIAATPKMYEVLELTRDNLQTLSDAALHYKKTFSANLEIMNKVLAEAEGRE